MRSHLFIIVIFLLTATRSNAQNSVFVTAGKIEYERKVNLYDRMNDNDWSDDSWNEVMKKAVPKFKTDYFELIFSKEKTRYQPGKENPENDKIPTWISEDAGDANVIVSDLDAGRGISQKKVFDQTFLLDDSLRKIKWKITDETRTIAGFACRRANAIIMDSIYVVAFYTDEIITPGGPESFTGLPGMILGVALPHRHVSWFATKVQVTEVGSADLAAPTKGKKVNYASLKDYLADKTKEWGKSGRRIVVAAIL